MFHGRGYPPGFSPKQRVKKALEGLDGWKNYDQFPLFIALLSGVNLLLVSGSV